MKRKNETSDPVANRVKELLDQKINTLSHRKGWPAEELHLNGEFNLYESGLLDSYDLFEFLTSIEEELEIEIDISELEPEEFTNYGNLLAILIRSKQEQDVDVD